MSNKFLRACGRDNYRAGPEEILFLLKLVLNCRSLLLEIIQEYWHVTKYVFAGMVFV